MPSFSPDLGQNAALVALHYELASFISYLGLAKTRTEDRLIVSMREKRGEGRDGRGARGNEGG